MREGWGVLLAGCRGLPLVQGDALAGQAHLEEDSGRRGQGAAVGVPFLVRLIPGEAGHLSHPAARAHPQQCSALMTQQPSHATTQQAHGAQAHA